MRKGEWTMEKCFLCKEEFHLCEGSSFRLKPGQKESSGVVCADCAYNYDEKLAKYNQGNVKTNDKVHSLRNNQEYLVSVVKEDCIHTQTKDGDSFPETPRLDFKDFVIL